MSNSPVEAFYNTLPAEMVAERVKENNNTNKYYWMNNKRGRLVPVSHLYVTDALMKGYTHTDGVLKSDDLTPQAVVPRVSEKRQLANALENLANLVPQPKVEVVETEVELSESALHKLTRAELEVLGLKKGFTQEQIDSCETKQAIIDLF